MSSKRVVVKFAKAWRGYSKGELAGFDESQAAVLVKGGVAELVKAAEVATRGSGKGTAKAKSAASGGDNTPAAGSEAPAAGSDTPPGDGDAGAADDDEPKP